MGSHRDDSPEKSFPILTQELFESILEKLAEEQRMASENLQITPVTLPKKKPAAVMMPPGSPNRKAI